MKQLLNFRFISACFVVAGFLFSMEPVFAQNALAFDEYARGHAAKQVGGFWYLFKLVCLVGGAVVCASCIALCVALAFEKAPPQLQQVGYKAPIIGAICGGALASITWFVGFAAKSATGQDVDNSTWQQLNGSIYINSAPAVYAETSQSIYYLKAV